MILRGTVFSNILQMETGISIITPHVLLPQKYKVVYLLHGIGGNHEKWVNHSMLPFYDKNGNTIFIMPEVARSFYTDMKYGFCYFTYITEELPEICKNLFSISAKREDTAIAGVSMGGYGALKAAFSKPELYGKCAAFSSACLFLKKALEEQKKYGIQKEFIERYGKQLYVDFQAILGEDLHWKPEHELLELAKKCEEKKQKPQIYMACGTEDSFYKENTIFYEKLKELSFDVTYESWEGNHDFLFFDTALKKAIENFL